MFEKSTQGAVSVIRCKKPLTAEITGQFEEAAHELLAIGQPMCVLDMTELPIIDSAGLESLLNIKTSFNRRGGTLKLASPNPLCMDILRITGLGERFEIHFDLSTAIGSFGK